MLIHPKGSQLLERAPLTADERQLIRQLHPLRRLHIDLQTEDLDRVLTAFMDDERILPIRMAHRLNDVRHLSRFNAQLQYRIAQESLHMYAPIAGRLSLQSCRREIEDSCFPILQPHVASELQRYQEAHRRMDRLCLRHASRHLQRGLDKAKIHYRIEHRIKSLFSTYRKMIVKHRTIDQLTDRLAIRIITDRIEDCYYILGIVHTSFHPMPGKVKDYIGCPKENGYQSIHTVVFPLPGVTDKPIEIQIRTKTMHDWCEYGRPKHAGYKTTTYLLQAKNTRVNVFRNLQYLRNNARSPQAFETALRTYYQKDTLIIFDVENRMTHVQKPITALDFALHLHGDACGTLRHIKINGRVSPLDQELSDADVVECAFGQAQSCCAEWLQFCKQKAAKQRIRQLLRKQKTTFR